MTQLESVSSRIRLKSSEQTFYGTVFVPQKMCVTTVVIRGARGNACVTLTSGSDTICHARHHVILRSADIGMAAQTVSLRAVGGLVLNRRTSRLVPRQSKRVRITP